jgi:hypothetical protein
MNATNAHSAIDIRSIEERQKATWESGDFGRVAKLTDRPAEYLEAQARRVAAN